MKGLLFSELNLLPKVQRAVEEMGYETATDIQSQVIPLIRTGVDVIGRSQTGTGKTAAFAIPAIERIDTHEEKPTLQVLILCPTRELAQQVHEEIEKLAKFKTGLHAVAIYGGAPMQAQISRLKRANIVIGTPGRIMDHMRRRTLKLHNLKMIVLDEADEMLSMGFRDDIESILSDAPAQRQTILFSATMPPTIVELAKKIQNEPQLIEINKSKIVLTEIQQSYVEVPIGRKMDALQLLLSFYRPRLALIFCNTKKMVDEIVAFLKQGGFDAMGLHGDMRQEQRTSVMHGFKTGKTTILVATDVAARGIDVNDIDYIINYDIPQSAEYYVHRIGRTGRAGKTGSAITICSGKKQVYILREMARAVKAEMKPIPLPSVASILVASEDTRTSQIKKLLQEAPHATYTNIVKNLMQYGYAAEDIAAVILQLHFGSEDLQLTDIPEEKKSYSQKPNAKKGSGSFIRTNKLGYDNKRIKAKTGKAPFMEKAGKSSKHATKHK